MVRSLFVDFYFCVLFFMYTLVVIFFFFSSRRRHTRLQGDWSSDVCSSDLLGPGGMAVGGIHRKTDDLHMPFVELGFQFGHVAELGRADRREVLRMREKDEIGRASCRERV